jgi:hypothetical protein
VDADHFDALARSLFAPRSRRSLAAVLGLLSLLGAGDAEAGKKGGGKMGKGKRKKHCVSAGESCTLSVHPCCGDTLCCDNGTGFRSCLPKDDCCTLLDAPCISSEQCCGVLCCKEGKCGYAGGTETKCSTDSSLECCMDYTCQNRDSSGFGTCQPG